MRFNIVELLKSLGVEETLYWGKRLIRALPQPGQYKNHSIVVNWREPERIRVELKAGLSGKTMTAKELANYPLQFQSETFFEMTVDTKGDAEDDGDAKGEKGRAGNAGKGGAAGHKHKRTREEGLSGFFASAHSEKVPTHAKLTKGVVMGMEIAREALDGVFTQFCEQVKHAKILATDLLASAGKAITRFTPPPFMAARGDEDKVYKYDRVKNETMFGVAPS